MDDDRVCSYSERLRLYCRALSLGIELSHQFHEPLANLENSAQKIASQRPRLRLCVESLFRQIRDCDPKNI